MVLTKHSNRIKTKKSTETNLYVTKLHEEIKFKASV